MIRMIARAATKTTPHKPRAFVFLSRFDKII